MLRVHYLNQSRAHRILWLMEELGLEYEVEVYHRGSDFLAPKALKAIHPLGKSPVVEDGDLKLAESGAIVEYLVSTYGQGKDLKPASDDPAIWQYQYWMHYAEGSAMPLVTNKLLFQMLPDRVPMLIRPFARLIGKGVSDGLLDPQLKTHMAFWDDTLKSNGWFVYDRFSAADIMMSFVVEATLNRISTDASELSHVRAYVADIQARPAYQRALEQSGYNYNLSQIG